MNFYFEAAQTLDRLNAREGSIKGVIATVPEKNRKRTGALVIETLKYKSALSEVIEKSQLLKQERKIKSLNLALVLVHDLLLAGGIQAGDGPIKQAVLRHKTRLSAELAKLKVKKDARDSASLALQTDARASQIPRYVRVNTRFWTCQEAIDYFIGKGFSMGDPLQSSAQLAKDVHIPDVLLFPPQMSFQDDSAYAAGKIILQDKASCIPAFVLSPPAHDKCVVIDATAAPGNKTSHLSALMKDKGKLFAFERDRNRFYTLKTMLSKAGCRNVEPMNADFLAADPSDPKFEQVTHILLDPSCSGSGIVNRLDYLLENNDRIDDQSRLSKLAAFQLKMIEHAMQFPNIEKIVYSTCSIHAIENEHVVSAALTSEHARAAGFTLAPRDEVLPTWPRRGDPDQMRAGDAMSVVRCLPGEDGTNGFFVACFVRRPEIKKRRRQKDNGDGNRRKKNRTVSE